MKNKSGINRQKACLEMQFSWYRWAADLTLRFLAASSDRRAWSVNWFMKFIRTNKPTAPKQTISGTKIREKFPVLNSDTQVIKRSRHNNWISDTKISLLMFLRGFLFVFFVFIFVLVFLSAVYFSITKIHSKTILVKNWVGEK